MPFKMSAYLFLILYFFLPLSLTAGCIDPLSSISQQESITDTEQEQVKSNFYRVKVNNFSEISNQIIDNALADLTGDLKHTAPKKIAPIKDLLTRGVLQPAIQNALLHGTRAWEYMKQDDADGIDHYRHEVPVTITTTISEKELIIRISNPNVKPFPERITRRFFDANYPIPDLLPEEKAGFKGWSGKSNFGTSSISEALKKLPPGSAVRWSPTADTIEFTIDIPLR